jgi:SAM-dependent methyltransferase
MSNLMIVDYVAGVVGDEIPEDRPLRHLDMGTGPGDMVERLRRRFPQLESCGVDYHPEQLALDVPVQHADLNIDRLPYEDGIFDLVTCTEVLEHLENYRHAIREAARVLRPGGMLVLSTPNVLSMKSRWAFLTRGFFTYFNPLPLKEDPKTYPAQRHITPVPFFYLGHTLLDAGFTQIKPHRDKVQKSSSFWAMPLGPFLRLATGRSRRHLTRRYWALPEGVEELARLNNSWLVLTTRTLIVTARKRDEP